ncbi:MobF family relaxase [Gluconobacter sp. P5H9_d]|uniref:MobF family relaxase n=2 Tax=unclassified Gluconobacter TaxID=2644261 RepID=UPI001C05D664|nr:MobF family relaxase [Gluconobacter sp. P5H9_d]
MITYRKLSAAGAGKLIVAYLREHQLEPEKDVRFERNGEKSQFETGDRLNSYYTGRDARGSWAPDMSERIASELGIDVTTRPTDEALARLFEGKRADTGEKWAGTHATREISGIDFTAAPDKSVTLAAEFASTKAEQALIWAAIHQANDRAMAFIAKEVGIARRGKGGVSYNEGGDVGWVSFRHYTARPVLKIQDGAQGPTAAVEVPVPGDPQAHIHNIMFNAVATESGHLGSLDTKRVTRMTSHMFGGYFQAELASELRKLGIRVDVDARGKAVVLNGIPEEARELFSKRSKQAERMAKAFVKRQGGDWKAMSAEQKFKILHQANLTYRSNKYTGRNERDIWREEADEIGWHHDTVLTDEKTVLLSQKERFEKAYGIAAKMLADEFRTAAVVDRDAFRTHAAHGLIASGIEGMEDVERVADLIQERGIEINGKQVRFLAREQDGRLRVATSAQIALEKDMARLAGLSARTRDGALSDEQIAAAVARSGLDFTREPAHGAAQLAAINALGQAGGLGFLIGVAGSGKTTLLKPLVDAWQEDGCTVIGAAIAWRQADALKDAGISQTYAMTPLLDGLAQGKIVLDRQSVLVLDEVSQVSPRQLLEILQLQQEKGFALRVVGDREQAQAIEAGDAVELLLRVMPKEARPELLSTIRQKSARGRQIASMFRSPGRDLSQTEDEQKKADIARAREAIDMKRKDGTIRLVGGDHDQVVEQIADLYLRRRDMLTQAGSERGITMSAPTNEDVMDLSRAVRDRLRKRGEIGQAEIVKAAIDQRGVTYELPLAVGDRVRLFAKTSVRMETAHGRRWRDLGSNGDFTTVKGWSDEGLVLQNAKGREGLVPWTRLADPKTGRVRLGFGHAMTVDAAQGVTSDEHINAMPRGSSAMTGFTSYVAESRHVHRCWTAVSEGSLREAETFSRALGDIRPVTVNDLYDRLASDMGRHPYKSLAVDLAKARLAHEEANTRWIRQNHVNERTRQKGQSPGGQVRRQVEESPIRDVPRAQWDDVSRKLRKAGYAAQDALNAARRVEDLQERRRTQQAEDRLQQARAAAQNEERERDRTRVRGAGRGM